MNLVIDHFHPPLAYWLLLFLEREVLQVALRQHRPPLQPDCQHHPTSKPLCKIGSLLSVVQTSIHISYPHFRYKPSRFEFRLHHPSTPSCNDLPRLYREDLTRWPGAKSIAQFPSQHDPYVSALGGSSRQYLLGGIRYENEWCMPPDL